MKAKSTGKREKRSVVSPEDQALFADAVREVAPLDSRSRDRVTIARPAVATPTYVSEVPPEHKLAVEGDSTRYAARSPGVSHAQIAQLRGGKVHVEETLDLHGERVDDAIGKLKQFLLDARRRGNRCVLVVHGKGLHSEHGAPLREAAIAALLGPLSGLVHAMASAAPRDGGDGATYVMLAHRGAM